MIKANVQRAAIASYLLAMSHLAAASSRPACKFRVRTCHSANRKRHPKAVWHIS